MKRKIALLLALAMTASMLPVNVFADSSNSVNKVVSVKEDDPVSEVYLKISPKETVTSGDSVVLTFTNSEVVSSSDLNGKYSFATLQGSGKSYESLMTDYQSYYASSSNEELAARRTLESFWQDANDAYIPWKLERNGKTQITVKLFPVPSTLCDRNLSYGSFNDSKAYYYIPLAVLADGTGDMTVSIDANETAISSSTITFARSTNDSGSTTAAVDEVQDFNESLTFNENNGNSIRIEENVSGTFDASKNGGDLTIRVNGGFQFTGSESSISVEPGKNSPVFKVGSIKVDDDKITIHFDSFNETTKASGIVINGITVEPEDEDKDWGAVNFTFKGIGITGETVQVANRADYGMTMKTEGEPTSILTGLSYVANSDLDEDDFVTADVHVTETIKDTWNVKQKMYFTLPEGVKIVSFEVDDLEQVTESVFANAYLTDGGSTLVVPRTENTGNGVTEGVDDDDTTEFTIRFFLTIDPEFGDNDITLGMYGGGIEQGELQDIVVAKAVTPITIATESTKTNIGYSSINTADVTITENVAGALIDNQDLVLSIDTLWTAGDIGFDDKNIEAEATGGELEIGKVRTTSGVIRIPVDSMSYSTPGSITVTGIAVGTSRSVPFGDYDLEVKGDAVLNNYDEDYDEDYGTDVMPKDGNLVNNKEYSYVWTQDNTDSYTFAKYLSVATQTGTLDKKVSVTIGETTIYVDDEPYTMDVAPYIQASSNSTMVPLRFVTLALGVDEDAVANDSTDETSTITWDAGSKTATIFYASGSGQKIIQFTAGSNSMVVDGTAVPMSYGVVAEITDSRMFVPFRALGTALGVQVDWDETTRTATYNG